MDVSGGRLAGGCYCLWCWLDIIFFLLLLLLFLAFLLVGFLETGVEKEEKEEKYQ